MFALSIASTPRVTRHLCQFVGNDGNGLSICTWYPKGVKNDPQKVALLLHTGGMELQEVYYTLVAEDQESTFENCLTVLDNYFTPKANVPFERHGFRQMEQLTGETIDQFVCRLRQKAVSCEFTSVEEAIRDQLIEKCKDLTLRRKFLEKFQGATLTILQNVARVHEAVNQQMQSMEHSSKTDQVNAMPSSKPENKSSKPKPGGRGRCYRSGETDHFARDCPALSKTCKKCGLTGHLAVCCQNKKSAKSIFKWQTAHPSTWCKSRRRRESG